MNEDSFALHAAGLYLADFFELSDVSVARRFIMEVALTGNDDVIRITKGDIYEEHRFSPNYLIGGPGKVLVDLDSVALFEKPDGTPHIIGPTGKERCGKATLEGFERFRQAIDIRDHYMDLRDQDDKSPSVKSRSLDGIPITATDVRLMFSVNRDGKKASTEEPYPFSPKAIEKLVYSAGSKVTPDQPNPSAFEFSWINNMIGLIRGKLGGFMSERNLTVYLASIGQPEFEKAKQREETIAQQEASQPDQISAAMIRNGAVVLGGFAAIDLLESQPDLKEALATNAFTTWPGVLRDCVEELAASLAAGRPQFFGGYVGWMQSMLTARGLPSGALPSAVTCLAKVLAVELPPESGARAAGVCEEALRALEGKVAESPSVLEPDTPHGRLAASYLLALLEGDRVRASRLILDAVQDSSSVPDLYLSCSRVCFAACHLKP